MKWLLLILLSLEFGALAQTVNPAAAARHSETAPKPLYRDPVYDGAADPVVIWNPHVRRWWMFYTNRRAKAPDLSGVTWVHGTRIGIAESDDGGLSWKYLGTAEVELPSEFGGDQATHWAPEVITAPDGLHHMFLSVVPGVFPDWNHPRSLVHLTSTNLHDWNHAQSLKLASDRVIDACVLRLPDGRWRLWYNNERDHKSIYYADSADLQTWKDFGKAVADQAGEGPKVFHWRGSYWMVTDVWRGLAVYRSADALAWQRQPGQLLETPGGGADDQVKGGHPDVVVSGDRAFLYYFTHPGRRGADERKDGYDQRRSSIQVTELELEDDRLACDRDKPVRIRLVPPATTAWRFDLSTNTPMPGWTQVAPGTGYSSERGYGFDLGSSPSLPGHLTNSPSFFFSVALPEGNYDVRATLGGAKAPKVTTVKAESRRLVLENIKTGPGESVTRAFTINVRAPQIGSEGQVRLKPREAGPPPVLDWDDKLTLEFNGADPEVSRLEIVKRDDAVTVYLAGDSTVTDQPNEPWNSWGQMLPRFFKPGIAIANHAESGESLPSFLGARRFEKILSTLKTGDYLFIQFGHNDQKDKRPGAGAFTTYKTNLLHFIAETRLRGATPVLLTPMERKAGVTHDTLGDFPAAVRQVADEAKAPLIDLHAMSKVFYLALGNDLGKAFQDGTHHNNYGSYQLAQCVITGIRSNHLPLVEFLAEDVPTFDPSHPDSPASFAVPASPATRSEKPEGN